MALRHKLAPMALWLAGKAPLCPWISVAKYAHPATWKARRPPADMEIVETQADCHVIRFQGEHDFWFPKSMMPCPELWSEYLVVMWNHPFNSHYYLRKGVGIKEGDVVIDCGCCEGFFARQALELGAGLVICLEPNVEMAKCLEATFSDEIEDGRVVVLPVAISSLCGSASFNVADDDVFSGRFVDAGDEHVPVETLDHLMEKYPAPNMIKMDLEGSEYEALRGAHELLVCHKPKLAITTYHESWDYRVISSYIEGVGYKKINVSASTYRKGETPRPVMVHAWK